MRRFYADALQGDMAFITGEDAQHISRVLRLLPGQQVLLMDGSGMEFHCELTSVGLNCEAKVLSATVSKAEPATFVTLYQAMPKGDKWEFILQKGTELGVSAFVPFVSAFTVAKPDAAKLPRWQKIAREACKQAGRARFPIIKQPLFFQDMLAELGKHSAALFFNERENAFPLRNAALAQDIALVVGSEGGFSPEEEARLRNAAQSVTLGERILRVETAAPVAAALTLHLRGELG